MATSDSDDEFTRLESAESPDDEISTIDEKLQLLSGATLWKLAPLRDGRPQLTVSDGPHGVRKPLGDLNLHESAPATCFPTAAAAACSWNPELMHRLGQALQNECLHQNIQILLGPGLNLKRHPAGGRTFEYWSEDPHLTGQLAASYIKGIQSSNRIGACAKHFAVNNQESHRFVVNAVVDERTARELYYRHFEYVVKEAQPATIMCAYNQVNGQYCSEHKGLMTDILRDEWGYKGVVMTDWGATNDRVAGIKAGIDLEMPGSHGVHRETILKAVKEGDLSESQVDVCANRMKALLRQYTAFGTDEQAAVAHPVDWEKQFQVAYQVAMESVVLLRNQDNCLPLEKGISVALIGEFARNHPRYQGMGSSRVTPRKVITTFDEVQRFTNTIHYAPGYKADDDEEVHPELIEEAVDVAQRSQVVILSIGLSEIMESEGFDRSHLKLPAQHTALVEAITAVHSNVVVLLSNGGVMELPWYDKVQAILEGYLLGEAGGAAFADLIFGKESPSGKLAETFPVTVHDVPADEQFPGSETQVEYREGLNVGYRYFDTADKPVRYAFGHGLSYTSFAYENLQLTQTDDARVMVTFRLTNTGCVDGKEVAQCYIRDVEASVYRPFHELRDFCKVSLKAGESKSITFDLSSNAFEFYDIGRKAWTLEKGLFEIRIGSSSRDIRLTSQVDIQQGVDQASLQAQETYPPILPTENCCPMDSVTFLRRVGGLIIQNELSHLEEGIFHRNSLLKHIAARRLLGKILLGVVYKAASKDIANEGASRKRQEKMVRANVENLPLRVLVLFSKGNLNFDLLDALIALMNWRLLLACSSFSKVFMGIFRRKQR